MEFSKQTLTRPPDASAQNFNGAPVMAYVFRPTVRRLFESWVEDMGILCEQLAKAKITEAQFFEALEVCRDRLKFYGAGGELSRDIDRLTEVLAGSERLERMDEARGDEEDLDDPESESGTGFANTNSNS